MGQTGRRRAKQKQLPVIGAAGKGADFPGQEARGCRGAQAARATARRSDPRRGRPLHMHAAVQTRLTFRATQQPQRAFLIRPPYQDVVKCPRTPLLSPTCSPRVVPVGSLSKRQKEMGQWTAVEVPSPQLLTASSPAERAQTLPLFPDVMQQERASFRSSSLVIFFHVLPTREIRK